MHRKTHGRKVFDPREMEDSLRAEKDNVELITPFQRPQHPWKQEFLVCLQVNGKEQKF